jgi:hypothetical protein
MKWAPILIGWAFYKAGRHIDGYVKNFCEDEFKRLVLTTYNSARLGSSSDAWISELCLSGTAQNKFSVVGSKVVGNG